MVAIAASSLSLPRKKRFWMYSLGGISKLDSRWCMLCCAMYETRRLWCFQIEPAPGSSSPTMFFKSVVFPAPFAPTIATRLESVTLAFTPSSTGALPPGYAKATSSTRSTTCCLFLMPSSPPGSGNEMSGLDCADLAAPPPRPEDIADAKPPPPRAEARVPRSSRLTPASAAERILEDRSLEEDASCPWPTAAMPSAAARFSISSTRSRFMRGSTRLGFSARKPANPPSNAVRHWSSKCTM